MSEGLGKYLGLVGATPHSQDWEQIPETVSLVMVVVSEGHGRVPSTKP
jgi:hypothetical protein